jgi:hypothetical protein
MFLLALTSPTGQPVSGIATVLVVLGVVGFVVGAAVRARRRV